MENEWPQLLWNTKAYRKAVASAGLRLYTGPDAAGQPPDLADFLLHETAIAIFKKNLWKARPKKKPWEETWEMFRHRGAGVVKEANKKANFKLLCCEYKTRLEMLVAKRGDRLKK